jgi:MFS family permease
MTDYAEFRRGGGVVLSSLVGIGLGLSPLPFYTLGLFAPYLAKAFHWNQATIMSGLLVMTVLIVLMGPLIGWLADRYGVRRVTLVSVVLFGVSLLGFALQDGSLSRYYLTWGVMAAVGAGTLPVTWTRAVNGWFDHRKGLALGLALIGTGVAALLLKPYTAWAIDAFGWRWAYVALAALPLLLAWPLALLCFKEPSPAAANAMGVTMAEPGMTLGAALRDWRFWLIGGAFLPIAFAVGGPIPNMELLLSTHGLSRPQIFTLLPLIGFFVIGGRLVGGWLVDRIWAPWVALLLLSAPIIAVVMVIYQPVTPSSALWLIGSLGVAIGMEYDLLAFLAARYFGTRHYGAIYGALYSFFAIGGGTAPSVYGHVYDVSRSFDGILLWGAFGMAGGALALCWLGPYRYTPRGGH